MVTMLDRWAERAVLARLETIKSGRLTLQLPEGARTFGPGGEPAGVLSVHDRRFFRRALTGGQMGIGESYLEGHWSSPDLVALVRLMLANGEVLAALPAFATLAARAWELLSHRLRDNTRTGSRRNIHAHYDLGNEFFGLFLDAGRMYSCAIYEHADDSLERAQINKLRTICDKLDLTPRDRVLEIGSGWGGFALFAATRYGCRVTTTTISEEQHAYVADLLARSGDAARRVDLRFEDYRDLRGTFDKIVSIEMFEAVGLRHYDEFFGACNRLLGRDGLMLLQTITVDDWRFREYRRSPGWIARYIFPGAELASLAEIFASLARVSRLGLHHAQQIGSHYARTLRDWRQRFHQRLDEVRARGFDERFVRMWDLYLAYCEGAFLERHIGDVQLLLSKAGNRRVLFDEPWSAQPAVSAVAAAGGRARHPQPFRFQT